MRLGTRGSALALAQARLVAEMLEGQGEPVELVPITTTGDRAGRPAMDKVRFVKEIEDALLESRVDLAVHSAKDVPAQLPDGLAVVGVPRRADPRDALCGAESLDELGEGAEVGTSSLRRRAQLLALRPDLRVAELRGNVDTRLRLLSEGRYEALVLAAAGLARLERAAEGAPLGADMFVPAPGQGCLLIEARADDDRAATTGAALTDPDALTALTAERALVARLGASCHTPVGAHARLDGDALRVSAFVGLPDGSRWARDELEGGREEPGALGAEVAERLLAAGADELLREAEAEAA